MIQRLRSLLYKEDGQSLGLLGIAAFFLMIVVMFVYTLGDFFLFWIRYQNAVDAAALSAASVMADNLNEIVKWNKIMRVVYSGLTAISTAVCWYPPTMPACCNGWKFWMSYIVMGFEYSQKYLLNYPTGGVAFNAAKESYQKSSGSAKIPIIKFVTYDPFNVLKLKECKQTIPKPCIQYIWEQTYCGLSEKDWGSEKKGSYDGQYKEDGPKVDVIAYEEYVSPLPWFRKTIQIVFKASARPYGCSIPEEYHWDYIYANTPNIRTFNFFDGEDTFSAKLVPFGE